MAAAVGKSATRKRKNFAGVRKATKGLVMVKAAIICLVLLSALVTPVNAPQSHFQPPPEPKIHPRIIDALIFVESSGRDWVVSSADAIGLMQIKPSTAAIFGYNRNDLFDPILNVEAGTAYLEHLFDRFGCIKIALQAYNCGPSRRNGIACQRYADKVLTLAYGD